MSNEQVDKPANPLSGWKKLLATAVGFVALIVGIIFEVDGERLAALATPLIYTVIEGVIDIIALFKK